MEGRRGDVRICGVLIIQFSVEVGTRGGHAPRGASCPISKDRGDSAQKGSALWDLLFVGLPHPSLTSQLFCMGWGLLCAETSPCIPIWHVFPLRGQFRKIQACVEIHPLFGTLSSCLTLNCSEMKRMGACI